MFNTLHAEDKKKVLYVQGSRIPSDFQDISGLTFQNYDKVKLKIFDLASIMTKNSESEQQAGTGDLVFKTSIQGVPSEQMYLNHLGHLGIGKNPKVNLDVLGDANISSRLTLPRIHFKIPDGEMTASKTATNSGTESKTIEYGRGPWIDMESDFTPIGHINESINKLRVRYPMCSAHVYKLEISYRFLNMSKESKALRVTGRYRYLNKEYQPVIKTWHEALIQSHPVGPSTSSPVTSAIGILDLRNAFDEINFDLDMDVELEFSAVVEEKITRNYGLDQCTLIVSTLIAQ
jgi:hypothetical protein